MKNDKLYTVNKWNQPAFMREGNVYWPGGEVQLAAPRVSPYIDWSNPFQRAAAIGTSAGLVNGFSSIANTTNPFNNSGGATAQPTKGSALTGILGAVGGTAGKLLGNAIADGYSTGGVGEGVADIGNMIGGAMQAIPGVGALAGTAVQFASGLIGGAINRGWGVKENKKNIEAIKQNTADARNAGNAVGGAATNEEVLTNSGMMTTGSGFSAGDLYKNGWWTNKGTKKGNELIAKENAALAYQNHGLVTGANNADNNMDSDIMRNFAAYGGLIPIGEPIGSRTDNMGAIEYGFMSDWIESRKNREKNKGNDFVGKPQNTLLALGGDLQNHGADWSTGLVHIDAGQSHEENPNDGVQMGVDPQGVPNLVEEDETVWNDYVFSNRIYADGGTLAKFHLPKKKKITYAEISKKLEKEIAERPNDPISIRGFETQMSDLADEQERQKAEMEAARARKAFEALSPEEQVALMEEAEQQEQMAQEQAMTAEQANMPGTEPMMAEGQAGAPSQEEMAMMQQQGQPEVAEGQPVMAEGGKINVFAGTQSGSNQMKNAGTFIKGTIGENWNTYTRNGLRDYLTNIIQRINMAPDEETKNAIRNEAITTVGNIQKAYAKAYQKDLTPSQENDAVRALQTAFQNAGGNAYFKGIDANINLPVGHNTEDTYEKGWIDGLWGPRTSIRNWGSTEYGDADSYKDIVDLATQAGLVYAPNNDWKYGDNTLYGLSLANNPTTDKSKVQSVAGQYGAEWAPENAGNTTVTPTGNAADAAGNSNDKKIVPNLRPTWMRYAGLFGPAVGLGMQLAGVGRPDYSGLDAALDMYDRAGTKLADYKTIGNYLTYRPMDIWAEQNRLNANSRGTERSILNSGANQGSKIAGLLAAGYNDQIASGNLYRKALEYNDALRNQVATFNRGTDQFNAEAYNRAALQNATAMNSGRSARAQLATNIAGKKLAGDEGWYNSLYGNIGGIFKGISDLGRENADRNQIARLVVSGAIPGVNPDNAIFSGYAKYAAKGGKLKRNKKCGLTF